MSEAEELADVKVIYSMIDENVEEEVKEQP